jgi:hypothetical protein
MYINTDGVKAKHVMTRASLVSTMGKQPGSEHLAW